MTKRSRNLTEGNIKKQLLSLTWPMLMGMMGMVIFNLVDTFFVGQLGVQELSAMSFSFPVIMFINSVTQGIGIGTTSLVSRKIIHAEKQEIRQIAGKSMLLGVLVVLVAISIGLLTIRPIFSSLGAKGIVLSEVSKYMRIWYLGVPFVIIPMIGNNILRATGDTFIPGMIMVTSGIINAVLDPLLIFGIGPFPEMGIEGAALATVISRSLGLVIILYILIRKLKMITLRFGGFKSILNTWKSILYIAGPASLTLLITPISIGVITKLLAGFGEHAVAAFGVASRIEMFVLMVIVSLGSVLIIFVGQNFSKHRYDRIQKAISYSFKFSLMWGAFVFILFALIGKPLASAFTDDLDVVKIAAHYFLIIGASYGLQGMVILSTSSFNALNKPFPSAMLSLTRMIFLYVPLAWIGSKLIGINGIFAAGFIANVTAGILAFKLLFRTVKKLQAKINVN